jgi:malonate-semialdehyde dehydrogenase (acetylating)/methylmalonate-semialdehyde dehydrogenase
MRELTHFIGGKHVKGVSGRFADAYQPMTGEVISKVPLASRAEVRAAVENSLATTRRSPRSSPASTGRPFPTPRATSSAASRSWSFASARRT